MLPPTVKGYLSDSSNLHTDPVQPLSRRGWEYESRATLISCRLESHQNQQTGGRNHYDYRHRTMYRPSTFLCSCIVPNAELAPTRDILRHGARNRTTHGCPGLRLRTSQQEPTLVHCHAIRNASPCLAILEAQRWPGTDINQPGRLPDAMALGPSPRNIWHPVPQLLVAHQHGSS